MLHLQGQNYVIVSGNTDFTNKQKSIFDQLDIAAKNNPRGSETKSDDSKMVVDCQPSKDVSRKRTNDMRHFKGQESIFKVPDVPLPNNLKKRLPDYLKNPHKWKRYSLCDVSEDDMSEQSNTAAAMAFLREVETRKSTEQMEPEPEEKITFKRPVRRGDKVATVSEENAEDTKCYFRGSKVVMPEYVVGQKKEKKKSRCDEKGKRKQPREVTLNHLVEDDLDD